MPNKKYYLLLIIFICIFNFIKVNSYKMPLKGKIIYLNPGHGGVDGGATYKDILEKNINLDICYELMSELENKGATVYMTRYDDYDLSVNGAYFRKRSDLYNRVKIINDSNADMYLSIHLNSLESSKWNGVQIFYDDINDNNKVLAQTIKDSLRSKREISIIKNKYMYNKIKVPGVLVELGFLSNSNDREIILNQDKRKILISNIVYGIIDYYINNNVKS